jgi:3'5'-cyclic nucleotide phosphodiesterase
LRDDEVRRFLSASVESTSILNEVVEDIEMPDLEAKVFLNRSKVDAEKIKLTTSAKMQLESLVRAIAAMYRPNLFHNFEHASHVARSLSVLLARVTALEQQTPPWGGGENSCSNHTSIKYFDDGNDDFMKALSHHNRTFGISSDPLTQLSMMFAALIHGIDHPGVSTVQLDLEGSPLLDKFQGGRCVVQQNAIYRVWKLFAHDNFRDLRNTICPILQELRRFRQILVTAVMATDLEDARFKELRQARWQLTFSSESLEGIRRGSNETLYNKDDFDRKATIVMEHLMQASVVAHSMQHWQ